MIVQPANSVTCLSDSRFGLVASSFANANHAGQSAHGALRRAVGNV